MVAEVEDIQSDVFFVIFQLWQLHQDYYKRALYEFHGFFAGRYLSGHLQVAHYGEQTDPNAIVDRVRKGGYP
ncbi:MAG: hypothetical protein ACYSTZ_06975, partial [Planctomycetota bacterium]